MDIRIERQKKTRWLYLGISTLLLLFLGLTYGWSIFRGPLEAEFGWSKQDTALVFTIQVIMYCVGGLASGMIVGKIGRKPTMILGAALIGAGLFFVSKVTTLMHLFISYSVVFGAGVGIVYYIIVGLIVRWFPDRQGTVTGIALFGYGSGAMVLGTVAAGIITFAGWRQTFFIFAIVYPLLVLIATVLIRDPSEEYLESFQGGGAGAAKPVVEEVEPREMLRRKNYWLYEIYAIALAAGGLAVINESTPFAIHVLGDNLTKAAAIAGIISIFNGVGRVLGGILFDLIGYKKTMFGIVVLYFLATAALIMAHRNQDAYFLIAAYVLIGCGYGAAVVMNPNFTGYFFGRENYNMNYSLVNLNPIFAALIGPLLGGGVFMRTFIFVGVFGAIAMVALMQLKSSTHRCT